MPYLPIQWGRQTVEGRQIESDGSRLLNFYVVAAVGDASPKVPTILYGTPGYRKWAKVDPQQFNQGGRDITPDAGIFGLLPVDSPTHGNRLFGISSEYQLFEIREGEGGDDVLPEYDPVRVNSPLHTVPSGRIRNFTLEPSQKATGPVRMVTDGQRILFISRREVFMWDMSAMDGAGDFVSLIAPTPEDLNAVLPDEDWVDCEWIDGYFLLAAQSGQFFHSLIKSEQFDQLDFASAEAKPDGLVGMRSFRRRLYLFGTDTIEQWSNVGAADFAFRRDSSTISNIGCAANATIQVNFDAIFFLGSDKIVYALAFPTPVRISNESVEYDIARSVVGDAVAFTYTEEGHRFYSLILNFRDGTKKNWTFDLMTRLWHERSLTEILVSASFQEKQIFGKRGEPYLYELSLDIGDHDREEVYREAVCPVVYANQQRSNAYYFEADISQREQSRYGLSDFDVLRDNVCLEWSDDGKNTFKTANRQPKSLNDGRFRWRRLGQVGHKGRNYKLCVTAKRQVQLFGAYITVDVSPD